MKITQRESRRISNIKEESGRISESRYNYVCLVNFKFGFLTAPKKIVLARGSVFSKVSTAYTFSFKYFRSMDPGYVSKAHATNLFPLSNQKVNSEHYHESTRGVSDFHCPIRKDLKHSNIITKVLEEFRFPLPNHRISRALRTLSRKCSENFQLPLSNHEISRALKHYHERTRRVSVFRCRTL